MNKDLVVVMASDNNYSFLLGNALYSLFNTNSTFRSINVYIIDDNISKENKEKLKYLTHKYSRILHFLQTPQLPTEITVKGNLNISTYYRLAICSLLPETVDKVLYLDCDILVRGSLLELWNIDINEYYLAGVQDTTGKYSRISVGLEKGSGYVNAGVLLINIAMWRNIHLENSFFRYLKQRKFRVEFNDQGIINHCCNSKIKFISPKYNYMSPYDRYDRKQLMRIVQKKDFYTIADIEEAKNNPLIVHFAGYAFVRPWFNGAKGNFIDEFQNISKLSTFSFELKEQPSGLKYRTRKFADSLPDNMAIFINQIIDYFNRIYPDFKR